MSGDEFNKKLSRKDFIKLGLASLSIPYLYSCNLSKKERQIPVSFAGENSKTGHLLRTNKFPAPSETKELDTIIVGGGVSGLSAARYLSKNNYNDYTLFELDNVVGGNAKSGKNTISEYPYAAHYLPIPNLHFTDLLDFLKEHNIITSYDLNGLPNYNEYYLCAEPKERMRYRGMWHSGIPIKNGLQDEEQKELNRFGLLIENYRKQIGKDNKPAFTIPLEWSSDDDEFNKLDKITMFDFLKENNFKTDFIYWYLNYCCKDDYGTDVKKTSAWAGIHYFASRNGKAANAESDELLTWPEGNAFLAKCLKKNIENNIKSNHLVYKIEKNTENWNCYVYDVNENKSILYTCNEIIMATPQFVNKHLLTDYSAINFNEFNYYPWLVANISIKDKRELNGSNDLSWDNVIYDSKSLGYVNSCHQRHNQLQNKTVITYYYNFSEKEAKQEREFIYEKDEKYWKDFILNDLKKAHPNIDELIDEIELYVLGHGMISPDVGFKKSELRKKLVDGFDGIHFVNSDVSGISIFEQAFYKGISASKIILKKKHES